jgi:selenocysteine-specific elongation factor
MGFHSHNAYLIQDSGKTSLVKALSTLLSTAALDKSKQSRQRGMTLDLGFSCFFLDMPAHLQTSTTTINNTSTTNNHKKTLQITLVDCPGHASLIRTIIGGAQIIDMVLLVVDACKGWQAQTTECLVLAELTSPCLIVALNKTDLLPSNQRHEQLQIATDLVRARLQHSRFKDAPILSVAACVGGEKVAAVAEDMNATVVKKNETHNIDALVNLLQETLPPPKRTKEGPFYFSIDHCFALRGRGTIVTGTVLSGSASVNDVLEFPTLSLERKIKSIQMFKRQIQTIQQGDRAGICVSNLDAKLLERGIAASPGAVQLWKGAIAVVKKVDYYHGTLPCGSKFHISVGHNTIMATVTFWGARELYEQLQKDDPETSNGETATHVGKKRILGSSSLGGGADIAGLPKLSYDYSQSFIQQDALLESLHSTSPAAISKARTEPLLHWALLDFQTPVHCPVHSLVIGSRLDTVDNASGSVSSCRLAFSGRLIQPIDPEVDACRVRLYTVKEKRGVISKLGDPYKRTDDGALVRYDVFGTDLFKKETNMKPFIGMKLETAKKEVGVIKASFGTDGKFRVFFPAGTEANEGDVLVMRFKRYANDSTKGMHQDGIVLPAARPGVLIEVDKKKSKKEKLPVGVKRIGEVASLKGDVLDNGKHNAAIISGFFAPEINVNEYVGCKVWISTTEEEGSIVGPFGKAGKCKVAFEKGISVDAGTKAELQL